MKNKKNTISFSLVATFVLAACGNQFEEMPELDRFIEARGVQTCYAASFEADSGTSFEELSEAEREEFYQGSYAVYRKQGFEVNNEADMLDLFQRLGEEAATKSAEEQQAYDDRYMEILESCLSPEELAGLENPPAPEAQLSEDELQGLIEQIEAQGGSVEVVPPGSSDAEGEAPVTE